MSPQDKQEQHAKRDEKTARRTFEAQIEAAITANVTDAEKLREIRKQLRKDSP